MRRTAIALVLSVLPAVPAVPAGAQEQPFRANDGGGFHDVLPPGTNGTANGVELLAFLTSGARPAHNDDQLRMYGDLVYAAPNLKRDELERYYKDASFGVREGDVARRYSPRSDVVVLRDRQFNVPHVYGTTRDGAMFGLGYVAAEDRMFLMDALRQVGRGRLSAFAGGAAGNRATDHEQWEVAPYTEADLQRQYDQFDDLYATDGATLQRDVRNYVEGVNAYIAETRINPLKLPGEYPALGRPQGPETWKVTDIVATAALVGGIFGKGGGNEVADAVLLQAMQKKLGSRKGLRLYRQLGALEDPEAPTTVRRKRFPYDVPPRRPRGVAMPDAGSVKPHQVVPEPPTQEQQVRAPGILDGLRLPSAMSNAMLISARESSSGRPLAVFGPQTGYFAPQLLMEQDVHAPASEAGPGIDARGASFAGTNIVVQLGRGRDYAWSATSAGQDIIDVFAVELCRPDGASPAVDSDHYVFRGQCIPMEKLERENCWVPSAAYQGPAGCETLTAWRTKLGLVRARATIDGKPVAYAALRATYMHEIDSAVGFVDLNAPERIRNVRDFKRAVHKILYTFNWFYADDKHIGYFNSGANPVRARGVDGNLPVRGERRFEWRGFDPADYSADITPAREHPQAINQPFLSSWNNKQARGYRGAGFGSFPPVHRVDLLDARIRPRIAGKRRMSLIDLVNQVEDAGTADLRGQEVLPHVLRAIGKPDPDLAEPLAKLREWVRTGAHRRDSDRDNRYDQADAVRLMDAWWEPMLHAIFEPVLGKDLFEAIRARYAFDDHNRDDHIGSAFQNGWYGWVDKDLRTLLGRRVRGRYSRIFCGRGSRSRCRRALQESLREALKADPAKLYEDARCPAPELPDLQMCDEGVAHSTTGGISQPLIHWINRPTYQQVVEVQSHRSR